MQAVSRGWMHTPLPFRGDVTSISASFSADSSECNSCTAGIPALKLGQLTFTQVPRNLQAGWFPPNHSKAWWRHRAAYYPWIKANADPVFASTLSETWTLHQHRCKGESGLWGSSHIRDISEGTWQEYVWVKCQENSAEKASNRNVVRTSDNQPIFWAYSSTSWHDHEHWWVDQNFRMVLRDKKRACNFTSTHTHEVSFCNRRFFGTYLREEGKGSVHAHVCAREDCLSICHYETPQKWDAALSYGDQLLFCMSQLFRLISVKYSSCCVYSR